MEVACLKGWGPVADQIRDSGIDVTAFGVTSAFQTRRAVRKLGDLIREHAIDTVFSFLVHANTVAAKTARAMPRVRWIQSIQTTQPKPRWHWWVQKRMAPLAHQVVVPSPSAAAVARQRAKIGERKIVIIPNAIDVEQLSTVAAEREPFLAQRHAVEAATRVGFLGRLDRVKRVEDLIRAMSKLCTAQMKAYHLHIFGDGAERAHLENVARSELGGRVEFEFHGTVDTPGEALKQIDVLVLPSEAEGFGLVLIEAMAAGVPVVATEVAGIRDVVGHLRTGILVPPRAPDQLATAIQRVMEDHALRHRMINSGLAEVRQKYSWDVVLPQYRRLLKIPIAGK